MRFLHTADWHLGKKLNGFDLLADQQAILAQIQTIAKEEQVDAMVIAGDLYDHHLPSETTVHLLNQTLQTINLNQKLPLLAISGNHDSAPRLATGSPWFENTAFYMHTQLAQAFEPVVLGDTQFFLLPYFEPFAARQYFDDPDLTTIASAMQAVIAKLKTLFLPDKKHVLVAHFFAAGGDIGSSETTLTIGGLDIVPLQLLADFDYVALGHLHSKDALHQERIRYSGAPLKFAIGEASQTKGVWIVDTAPFHVKFVPLKPIRELRQLKASFAELLTPAFYEQQATDDYLAVTLTDDDIIPNLRGRLQAIYPHLLQVRRLQGAVQLTQATQAVAQLAPMDLLADYYQALNGTVLTDNQQKWAQEQLRTVEKGEK